MTSKDTKRVAVNQKTPAYNRLEQVIAHLVKFPEPEKVYELYLKRFIGRLDQRKWSKEKRAQLEKNTHESRVRLLAAILESHTLFQELLEVLPREVVALIHICAHEGDRHDLDLVVGLKVRQLLCAEPPGEREAIQALFRQARTHPAFFMFQVKESWSSWRYDGKVSYISLNSLLKNVILRLVPKHPLCHLRPVPGMDKTGLMFHKDHGAIFQQLPVILTFISQDNLHYSKSGEKILMRSLKKMAEICNIREFYTDGDNALKLMKTSLLADFLSCGATWTAEELNNMPRFIKERIRRFFNYKDFKSYRCRELFHYIKRQMVECDLESDEKKMRTSIWKMFAMLPPEEWVSTHDIARAAFYSHMDFNPFSRNQEFQSLYIRSNFGIDAATRIENKLDVYHAYKFDVLTLPFVKGILFLLGALGLVDLGYTQPENEIYQQCEKPWLSIYDGLKYVRLTTFGNYVAGRRDHFTAKIEIRTSEIEVDEQNTMLSIYGEDPIKKLALDQLGEQINTSSYVVNYQTFLRECTTSMDVENKIKFFRDHISQNPPEIWENFFKAALARINPLETVSDISVFRVKPDGELLSLLTKDPVLKTHVIKAENYHLLVETAHLSKVKKRLAQFGFFMTAMER